MRPADHSSSRRGAPSLSSGSIAGRHLGCLGGLLASCLCPFVAAEGSEIETLLAAAANTTTHRIEVHDNGRELHIAGSEGEDERLLVGAIIRGKEAGAIEVIRRNGRYQVPLEPFAELTRTGLVWTEDLLRLETPFGNVELEAGDLLEIGGTKYLSQTLIESRLATPILFDAEQFALVFDLPWRPELVDLENLEPPPAPEADVFPPRASLSTIRIQASSTTTETESRLASTTTVGGRLASGFWRVRYEDDFEGRNELREYSWLRTAGRQRYLVGQQRPHVHPLLESLEFTGLQVASTNQPLELFSPTPEFGELLSRRLQPLTSVRGDGPPAGLAELRIDGEVISQQVIGLDGRYEFLEIPLESRRLSRLEILLFDRHNLSVPVAIHEKNQSANDLLLAPGARILIGGAGREGNLLADDDAISARGVGFLQWRQGVTPRLTVEAAVQEGRESRRAVAGLISRLGPGTVLSFATARSEDGLGYDLALERLRGRWRLLTQSRWLEEGFLGPEAGELYHHDVEVGYRTGRLDLALIGRSSRDADRQEEHLLPALAWRPTNRLFLRARPDRFGDYRYDAAYRFGSRARLGASYQDRLSVDLTTRLRDRYYLTLDGQWGDEEPDRYSAIVRWFDAGGWRPNWSAGLLYSEGGDQVGYLAGVTAEVRDGLRARVEISNPDGTSDGHRVVVGLTANLAVARGRLLSGRRRAVRDDRGAIAGRVRPDVPGGFPTYPLGELRIFLDGKLATTTEPDGTFFVGNLKEGVHRIELDPENLPLELVPRRLALFAEVASAAVTRVDFEVIPEFGIAGRLTTKGQPLPEVFLQVVDSAGNVVGRGRSDRFGYYRIDRLPPGRYTLRVALGELDVVDELECIGRSFEILDDFLFGVDLEVDPRQTIH